MPTVIVWIIMAWPKQSCIDTAQASRAIAADVKTAPVDPAPVVRVSYVAPIKGEYGACWDVFASSVTLSLVP